MQIAENPYDLQQFVDILVIEFTKRTVLEYQETEAMVIQRER